jgi:hypothetical protein
LLENVRTLSTVKFDWDPTKSASNEAKHGISLSAATALWADSIVTLPSKNPGEPRCLAIGLIDGLHWTVVYTFRNDIHRLISARRSRTDEKALYKTLIR